MKSLGELEGSVVFAFQLQSNDLVMLTKFKQRASVCGMRSAQDNDEMLWYLPIQDEAKVSELELSALVVDLFAFVCVSQVLGLKYQFHMKSSFAHRLDQLPSDYSRVWNAVFQEAKRFVIGLAE